MHLEFHSLYSTGCVSDGQEAEYTKLVESFQVWCENNNPNLILNNTIYILGEEVEVVVPGTLQTTECNTEAVYKKGQSRQFFLKKEGPSVSA